MASKCVFCLHPMPKIPWWKWPFTLGPLSHDPLGPDGDRCWRDFCANVGIKNPGPNPARRKRG